MNLSWARNILKDLGALGVEEFVFCAGARNSPLIFALEQAQDARSYSFFEERSASFFALGLARRSGRPVAVITTSGTAAAELLPATIEAFHTGVPLVMVTADRPRRLRGTGAPQAIDQTGLFAKFVEREFDLENGERAKVTSWSRRAPLHLNICFDEPLIDEKPESFSINAASLPPFTGLSRIGDRSLADARNAITKFVSGVSREELLIVVGTLETENERSSVARLIQKLQAATYLEGTSGLRERAELAPHALRSGDKILAHALTNYGIKRVLRLGAVPTARVWRDLEDASTKVETLSVSSLPFAGLSRGQFFCTDLTQALENLELAIAPSKGELSLFKRDREILVNVDKLFKDEPKAEPSLFRALSEKIPASALIYVGNSLPIREWDLAATHACSHVVEANRGVNGIDGQVSTFLGLAPARNESWCVIGDLTAMYDLAAPWAAKQKELGPATIAVINNGGGQIFHRMFKNELFENRHDFDFKNWAAQWRWSYERWTEIPAEASTSKTRIVEIVPDAAATARFWDRYDAFFK